MLGTAQSQQLPILWVLSRALVHADAPPKLLDSALRVLVDIPEFAAGCAHLYDLERREGALMSQIGLDDQQLLTATERDDPAPMLETAAMRGGPFMLSDADIVRPGTLAEWEGFDPAATLCIPLFGLQGKFAHLLLVCTEPGAVTLSDDWHLHAIVGQLVSSALAYSLSSRKLADQVLLLQFLIDMIPSPIFFRDQNGVYLGCNRDFEEFVGQSREQIVGRTVFELPSELRDQRFLHQEVDLLTTSGLHVSETQVACADGRVRDVLLRRSAFRDSDGNLGGVVAVLLDITERKRVERELLALSRRDQLTGLANRRAFEERLNHEWRRAMRAAKPLWVVMVDIDHFKRYNDTNGHLAGDECLRRVGRVIEDTFQRAGELAARWGGEEFAVVIAESDRAAVEERAEMLRRRVEEAAIPASPKGGCLTVSVGTASVVPMRGSRPKDLVSLADEALYAAKRAGRNRVRRFQEG